MAELRMLPTQRFIVFIFKIYKNMSETQIEEKIAEIILDLVNKPNYPDLKDILVNEFHISRRMLTPKKLFRSGNATFLRMMLCFCRYVSEKELDKMLDDIRDETKSFADREDGSLEALIKAHAGSPINRKKKK